MRYLIITIVVLIGTYLIYPNIYLRYHSKTLESLTVECLDAQAYYDQIDLLTEYETIDTRVNVFMNAEFNQSFCYDLEVFESQLLANRVSLEAINFVKLSATQNSFRAISQ
jgi:hypothetical protein